MRILAIPLLVIAGTGFLLSLAAHVTSLFGKPLPGGDWVFALHIGIFLVWFPLIALVNTRFGRVDRKHPWHVMLANCPQWMRRLMTLVFAYAVVNFFLFIASTIGQPKPSGPAPPSVIRGFSGHWMAFYGIASTTSLALLRAAKKKDESVEQMTCEQA